MDRILLTAWITLRQILARKAFYIMLGAAGLAIAVVVGSQGMINMFMKAGEAQAAYQMKARLLTSSIGIWGFFSMCMGLFFGSSALAWDIESRAILTILAKPIDRWEYLLGKWIGLVLFIGAFLVLGIGASVGFGLWAGLQLPAPFFIALAGVFVTAFWFSGVALGLSVRHPPAGAGVLTFAIYVIPDMMRRHLDHGHPLMRLLANTAHYLGPADSSANRLLNAVVQTPGEVDTCLHLQTFAENILYAAAFFMIGAWLFSRRDIPIRSA